MSNGPDIFTTFNFSVELYVGKDADSSLSTPLCHAEFAECDGLEMSMEPKTVREGGNNTQVIHLVGPVTYGNVTLKRGMTTSLDLWKWFKLATGGEKRATKAQGVIYMRDAAGNAALKFSLVDCLPLKVRAPSFNARDSIVAIEEMQLAYKSLDVNLPD